MRLIVVGNVTSAPPAARAPEVLIDDVISGREPSPAKGIPPQVREPAPDLDDGR
jgi:hypothetical protein